MERNHLRLRGKEMNYFSVNTWLEHKRAKVNSCDMATHWAPTLQGTDLGTVAQETAFLEQAWWRFLVGPVYTPHPPFLGTWLPRSQLHLPASLEARSGHVGECTFRNGPLKAETAPPLPFTPSSCLETGHEGRSCSSRLGLQGENCFVRMAE